MLIKSISHAIDGRLNALTDLLWMILDVICLPLQSHG